MAVAAQFRVPRIAVLILLASIAGVTNSVLAQCTSAFAGSKAVGKMSGKQSKVTSDKVPDYAYEEVRHLAQAFGFQATLQVMDGAGACVNADDSLVLIGRGLSARILSTMKRELPGPMSKNDLFADRDALLRGGISYVIVHEFAHLFQHAQSQVGSPVPTNEAAFELQADCIAGLWFGYQPSAKLYSETPVIRGALATAMVFGNSVGDFPTVGIQEQINATGHSTGVKRMSCVQSGIGNGRIQRFGKLSTAFQAHAKDLLLWAADGAQHYLTPFPGGSQNK
jgi:hypothetical protein